MFLICAANVFSAYLTWESIPTMVADALTGNISDPLVMLLVINLILLLVGAFFEGGSAMILMAPLFVPVMRQRANTAPFTDIWQKPSINGSCLQWAKPSPFSLDRMPT